MKPSHVNLMNMKYKNNTQKVIQDTTITPNEYNNLWLDAGLNLIKELCSFPELGLFMYEQQITEDQRFWKWLRNEWNKLEHQYLETFGYKKIDTEHYLRNMTQKVDKMDLKRSFFEQYLPRLTPINYEHK